MKDCCPSANQQRKIILPKIYEPKKAEEKIYHYFWHTFADKIIESRKRHLNGTNKKERQASQYILLEILKTNLKILHPFIPFITEEIYQKLPIKNKKKYLMIEEWPA